MTNDQFPMTNDGAGMNRAEMEACHGLPSPVAVGHWELVFA
jgi:hypothetical protein